MRRRSFLSTVGGTVLATSMLQPRISRAIDPISRSGPSLLRLSLSAYSFRNELVATEGRPAAMTLMDFVDYCSENEIAGCELTSYYFPEQHVDEFTSDLKLHCHRQGLSVSGGAIRNDFCTASLEKLKNDFEHTKSWIDRYQALGATAIRIFAGYQPKGRDWDSTIAQCVEYCQKSADYAHERGMMLALENHGGVTATATGLLEIVRQVESPAFGVNLDSGNFRSSSDPYAELTEIAPYAINAQLKVEMFPNGVAEPTDFERIVKILRQANYRGWLALEYESDEPPRTAIPEHLATLKSILG